MSKPDLTKWVPDDDVSKISAPGSTKEAAGFLYEEKPPFQFFNWLFNRISKWLMGLQGGYFDIVVGSATQVTNNEATHVLADLTDVLVIAGTKVLILDGTHTLLANFSLINDSIKLQSESVNAIIDVSTFTFTLSGNNVDAELKIINSGANDVIISGVGSYFKGLDLPIENIITNDSCVALTTGLLGGIKVRPVYKWTSATQIGASFTIATLGNAAIASLNSTDVAFIDANNDELRTYRWNGSTWSLVGSGLAIATISGVAALTSLNSTDVAFIDAGNGELRTYTWNGSTWSLVGSGLAITNTSPALTSLNSTDVAFIDANNDELRTYRWNGSTWSLVGSGLALINTDAAITRMNSTDIALADTTNDELRTYRFNGSTWALVGSGIAIGGIAAFNGITSLNSSDVAYLDGNNDTLEIYRFNGSIWSIIGDGLNIPTGGIPALACLNGTDIALVDVSASELRVYRFGFSL